ncbi:hypothetical protein ACWCO4_24320, partial [Streptomyces virginiae]
TGAPITAQMTAGKIDIGSMGDFPLLINAARGEWEGRAAGQAVAAAGCGVASTTAGAAGSSSGEPEAVA